MASSRRQRCTPAALWFVRLALLSLFALGAAVGSTHAAGHPILVVVGRASPATDISLADLKASFRGRGISVAGMRLIPINHALGTPLRVAFDRLVLGLEPAAVGRFWIDQRIRDAGKPPTTAPTLDLALRAVASLPGAVSYTTREFVHPKVKVLTVEGKTPEQPGYPLVQ